MKIRVPHTYVLLFILILLAAVATHFIPAGEFDQIAREGRKLVVPNSYHRVPARPAQFGDFVMAFPKGLEEVAYIVFYIFIVGGAFGVIEKTGAITAGIHGVVRRLGKFELAVVPVLTLVFAIGGGTFGMAEETLPFLPALVLLSRSLGYDALVGGGIALAGAGAGFAGAFLNPFTVGVAQGIAGLPLFSGVEFRLVVWLILTAVTIGFLSRYAAKIRKAPNSSLLWHHDQEPLAHGASESSHLPPVRLFAVMSVSFVAFGLLIYGALFWGWGIAELSGLFLALAMVAGPVGGLSFNETAEAFITGAASLTGGALVVGLARGALVILSEAKVIDTIMTWLATLIDPLPAAFNVLGIYAIQILLNFIVPSGSGQAALSIPLLAPLADMLGITRQTVVLAYQFGDGFTNVFTPTQGYFMAGLALIKVPWNVWARWILPLLLTWWAIGAATLLVAHAIRLGPF